MIKISINQGKVIIIDDDDFDRISKYHWIVCKTGYVKTVVNYETIILHRFIMNAKKGQQLDHVNGDTLDNRKENLRFCSTSQNLANRKRFINNRSGYKGVDWRPIEKKFRARLSINKRAIHLGYFSDPKDAAFAYDRAAKEYFGSFARINFAEEKPC